MQGIAITHEPLAPAHVDFYVHQRWLRALAPLRAGHDYVRTDLLFRLRNKLAFWLGKLLKPVFASAQRTAPGHSIIGTASKPAG